MPIDLASAEALGTLAGVGSAVVAAVAAVLTAKRKSKSDDAQSIATLRIAGLEAHERMITKLEDRLSKTERRLSDALSAHDECQLNLIRLERRICELERVT